MKRTGWPLIVRKIFVLAAAIVVFSISVSALMISIYRQDIIDLAWKQLKASIKTQSNAQSIDLSFWSSFPMVSIELKGFWIEDSYQKDTLFYADRTYLSFDIWDAWRGKYEVNKLILRKGRIDLKESDRKGKNWLVFDKISSQNDTLPVSLKKLVLEEFEIQYENDSGIESDFWIQSGKLKGDFSVDEIELDVDITGKSVQLKVDEKKWLDNQDFGLHGNVLFDQLHEHISFKDTDVKLFQSALHLNGYVDFRDAKMDGTLISEELEAAALTQSMPDFVKHWIHQYEPQGRLSFKSNAKGSFGNPEVVAEVKWNAGSLVEPTSKIALENIDLIMQYQLKDHLDAIRIHSLSANLGKGKCSLKGELTNFKDPSVSVHLDVETEISETKEYLKWDTLEVASGKFQLSVDLLGKTAVLADSTMDWTQINVKGGVIISNGDFQFKNSLLRFKDVYVVMQLFDQSAQIQQFTAGVGDSRWELNGSVQNLIPYLSRENETLNTSISFHCQNLDTKDFAAVAQQSNTSWFLPRTFWNVTGTIDDFHFDKVNAHNVEIRANASPEKLDVEQFKMQLAEGTCEGAFLVNQTQDLNWYADARLMVNSVNVKQLFAQFENFGQEVIKTEQLSGKLSTDIDLNFILDQQLNVQRPSIQFVADVQLREGSISKLKWLQDVSEYIKKNRWIAPVVDEELLAQRLEEVQFSELKNIISLSHQVLEIPWMEINTSAFNMVLRGSHHFNVELNYLFGIQVSDLLLRDPTQKPKEDGKKMYIQMKGAPDNLVFSVEREPEDFVFDVGSQEQKIYWKDRLKRNWMSGPKKLSQPKIGIQNRKERNERKNRGKRREP